MCVDIMYPIEIPKRMSIIRRDFILFGIIKIGVYDGSNHNIHDPALMDIKVIKVIGRTTS